MDDFLNNLLWRACLWAVVLTQWSPQVLFNPYQSVIFEAIYHLFLLTSLCKGMCFYQSPLDYSHDQSCSSDFWEYMTEYLTWTVLLLWNSSQSCFLVKLDHWSNMKKWVPEPGTTISTTIRYSRSERDRGWSAVLPFLHVLCNESLSPLRFSSLHIRDRLICLDLQTIRTSISQLCDRLLSLKDVPFSVTAWKTILRPLPWPGVRTTDTILSLSAQSTVVF